MTVIIKQNLKSMIFDIDIICDIVIKYLIDEKSICYTIHKLLHIFKEKKVFTDQLCEHFINIQFKKYNISDNNFYVLLQKICRKINIKYFPCYNIFLRNYEDNKDVFSMENLKAKHRRILYYLSIYYRYIWYTQNIDYFGSFGYDMYNKVKYDTYYNYKYLKMNRIYNPKYFEPKNTNKSNLVSIKSDNLFKLRKNSQIYKNGITRTRKTLIFKKL